MSSPASEAVSSPGPTLQLIAFNGTAGPASRSTNVNQADDLCRGLPSHGHIAAHRHSLGLSVFGVDQSAQMLATGRTRYPEVRFALSSITRLGPADGSCRGVLSRSSVIHLPPRLLPTALAEIAGVLAPGGWLLISFSATDAPEPPYEYYDHRVAAACRWWPDHVVSLLRSAGITESARLMENPGPDDRRQFRVASILARKPSTDGTAG